MATPTTIDGKSLTVTIHKGQSLMAGGISLQRLAGDQFRLTMPDGVSYRIATPEKPVVQSPQRPRSDPDDVG